MPREFISHLPKGQAIPESLRNHYLQTGLIEPTCQKKDKKYQPRRALSLLLGLTLAASSCNFQDQEKPPATEVVESIPDLFMPKSDFVNGIFLEPGEMEINPQAIGRSEFKLNIGPIPELVKVTFTDYQLGHFIYFGETVSGKEVIITYNLLEKTTLSEVIDGAHTTRLLPVREGVVKKGRTLEDVELRDEVLSTPNTVANKISMNAPIDTDQSQERMADILFYITDEAIEEFGGEKGARASIAARVAMVNKTFISSKIDGNRIRLVGVRVIPEVPGLSSSRWAEKMANTEDGLLDDIPNHRDSYGADLVGVVFTDTTSSEFCGSAYRLAAGHLRDIQSYYYHAVSAMNTLCIMPPGGNTLAHELGHIYGLSHDPRTLGASYPDVIADSIAEDAFGYVGTKVSDIMAYYYPGRDTKLIYSSPDVSAQGEPIGEKSVSNAARVLREVSGQLIPQLQEKVFPQYNLRITKVIPFLKDGVIQLEGTWDSDQTPEDVVTTVNWGSTYPVDIISSGPNKGWRVTLPTHGSEIRDIPVAIYPFDGVDASITSFRNPGYSGK